MSFIIKSSLGCVGVKGWKSESGAVAAFWGENRIEKWYRGGGRVPASMYVTYEITRNIFVVEALLVSPLISSIKSKLPYICVGACVCVISIFKEVLYLQLSKTDCNINASLHHSFRVHHTLIYYLYLYCAHLSVFTLLDP